MSFKTAVIAPLALLTLAASISAHAAPIRHSIQLEASIPTDSFAVEPIRPGLVTDINYLTWNMAAETLGGLHERFFAKNTSGAIEGRILEAATLNSGLGSIDLEVKFNGVTLSTTPAEVVASADAALAPTVYLDIEPQEPTGGYVAGTYVGVVNLEFDAVP